MTPDEKRIAILEEKIFALRCDLARRDDQIKSLHAIVELREEQLTQCKAELEAELARGNKEARDGNWLDRWGCCKVCDGEIPYGHTDNCDIYKMESELEKVRKEACKLKACEEELAKAKEYHADTIKELNKKRDELAKVKTEKDELFFYVQHKDEMEFISSKTQNRVKELEQQLAKAKKDGERLEAELDEAGRHLQKFQDQRMDALEKWEGCVKKLGDCTGLLEPLRASHKELVEALRDMIDCADTRYCQRVKDNAEKAPSHAEAVLNQDTNPNKANP